jgi:hypothetical protein
MYVALDAVSGFPNHLRRCPEVNPLPTTIDVSDEATSGVRYAYKSSLIGAAQQFELTDAGLSWRVSGKSAVWPYAGISAIRLSYRPMSMQPHRFRADIENAGGARLVIFSTSWQTVTLMTPQDGDYRAFMTQLHQRMREAGSRATLSGGIGTKAYAGAVLLLALVAISITGLFARAIDTGEFYGALFLVGFAALFGWQIGGFVRRNRPRAYTFDQLPEELLP